MWNYTSTLYNSTSGAYPSFKVNTALGAGDSTGPWSNALILVNVQTMSTTTSVQDSVFGNYTKVTSIAQADGLGESSLWVSGPYDYPVWNNFDITAFVTTGTNIGSPSQTSQSFATATILIPSDSYTASGVITSVSAVTGVGGNPKLVEATLVADPGTQMFWTVGSNHNVGGTFVNLTPHRGSGGDNGGVTISSGFASGFSAYNIVDTWIWSNITPLGTGNRTLDYNFISTSSSLPASGWNWTALGASITYPGSAPVITRNRVTNYVTNYWDSPNPLLTTSRTCPPYKFLYTAANEDTSGDNFYSPMAPILAGDTIICCIGNNHNIVPTGVSDNINGSYTLVTSLSMTDFFLSSIFIYTISSSASIPNPGRDWVVTANAPSSVEWGIFTVVLSPGATIDNIAQRAEILTVINNVFTVNMTPAVFSSNANEWFLSLFIEQDNFNGAFGGSPGVTLTGQPQYGKNAGHLTWSSGTAFQQPPTLFPQLPGQIVAPAGAIPSGRHYDGTGVSGQEGYAWIETTWKAIGETTAPLALATPKYFTTFKNTPLIVYPTGLLNGDIGTGITVTGHTSPSHGTLSSFGTDGTFTYTPTTDYVGLDVFNYTITDIFGQTSTSTANFNVVNDVLGILKVQRKFYK